MRLFYFLLASISLGLGLIGVVLPILPTVPFLLVTAYGYSKSSVRFDTWFRNSHLYKKYLQEFIENRTMTWQKKWSLLIFVDVILITSFLLVDGPVPKLIIILVFIVKHYYFHKYVKVVKS
jgi:uncharacterized membrane protein YbaN (DUF454 family)